MDIPALAENWFRDDFHHPLKDPRASITLSATGLAFNIVANSLLLVRYSSTISERFWKWATTVSVLCWWGKVGLALANISLFGLARPGAFRTEGFWCAVASLVLCGMISIFLSFHWIFSPPLDDTDESMREAQIAVRISGRHFMLSVTCFVVDLCLFALVTSRLESWSYFQGIYFSITTFTTVGFGDYIPTTTATRIVLVPFTIIAIAQLANIVTMHVSFFASRAAERRSEHRREYEALRQKKLEEMDHAMWNGAQKGETIRRPDLAKEFEYLDTLRKSYDRKDQIRQVTLSIGGLVVFWLVGAAIFHQLEDWTYGVGLYFCFAVFITLGYGDYAPVTPGGRVVFVIYALVAVPVMATFGVNTVCRIFTTMSEKRLRHQQAKQAKRITSSVRYDVEKGRHPHHQHALAFVPHSEFVTRFHREWDEEQATENQDVLLLERVIELALAVERRSRKLLIAHLGHGSTARMLLEADRNVQLREVRTIQRRGSLMQDANMTRPNNGSTGVVLSREESGVITSLLENNHDAAPLTTMNDAETLAEVEQYRKDFAGLIVAGSRLLKLNGEEQALFEKRWEAVMDIADDGEL